MITLWMTYTCLCDYNTVLLGLFSLLLFTPFHVHILVYWSSKFRLNDWISTFVPKFLSNFVVFWHCCSGRHFILAHKQVIKKTETWIKSTTSVWLVYYYVYSIKNSVNYQIMKSNILFASATSATHTNQLYISQCISNLQTPQTCLFQIGMLLNKSIAIHIIQICHVESFAIARKQLVSC